MTQQLGESRNSRRCVLLVIPPADSQFRDGQGLGVGYLAGALKASRFQVMVATSDELECMPDVAPFLVGVSTMFTAQLPIALKLVRELKMRFPGAHLIIGGNGVSFLWTEVLKSESCLDSAACFESEETIVDLAASLQEGSGLDKVVGLYWRDQLGQIRFNGFRDPPDNLDALPMPVRNSRYLIDGQEHLAILTSRGCSAHCTFCQSGNYGNRYHSGSKWRARSPSSIVEELVLLSTRYGVTSFSIVDDDFLGACSAGQERAKQFCGELRRAGLNIHFSIECRAEEIARPLFEELREVGLSHTFFGVESAFEPELRLYGKRQSVVQCVEAMNLLRELGIFFTVGFIMFQPLSSMDSIRCNVEFLRGQQLLTPARLTNRLQLYPGGPLTTFFKRRGDPPMCYSDFIWTYDFADAHVTQIYDKFMLLARAAGSVESQLFRSIFASQMTDEDWGIPARKLQRLSDSVGELAIGILDDVLHPEAAALKCREIAQSL